MDAKTRVRWHKLVDAFDLNEKAGLQPWDALKADALQGLSSGEEHVVCFLLNVWDTRRKWNHPRLDMINALGCWDDTRNKAFLSWVNDPWWP